MDFEIICPRCGKRESRKRMHPRFIDKPCYCWGCAHIGCQSGKTVTADVKRRISNKLMGHKQSDATRLKKSLSKKGKPLHPNNIQAMYDKGIWIKPEDRTAWDLYKLQVRRLMKRLDTSHLEHSEKRGSSGKLGAYHLDHKYSIRSGFDNGVDPKIICSIVNLEYIPYSKNCSKQNGCSITKEQLFERYKQEN